MGMLAHLALKCAAALAAMAIFSSAANATPNWTVAAQIDSVIMTAFSQRSSIRAFAGSCFSDRIQGVWVDK